MRSVPRSPFEPTAPQRWTTPFETTISDSFKTVLGFFGCAGCAVRQFFQKIDAADDPDQLAAMDHWHALDPMFFHGIGDFAQGCQRVDRDDVAGHDISHSPRVGLYVIGGEPRITTCPSVNAAALCRFQRGGGGRPR
jgi:hypothetical protein